MGEGDWTGLNCLVEEFLLVVEQFEVVLEGGSLSEAVARGRRECGGVAVPRRLGQARQERRVKGRPQRRAHPGFERAGRGGGEGEGSGRRTRESRSARARAPPLLSPPLADF